MISFFAEIMYTWNIVLAASIIWYLPRGARAKAHIVAVTEEHQATLARREQSYIFKGTCDAEFAPRFALIHRASQLNTCVLLPLRFSRLSNGDLVVSNELSLSAVIDVSRSIFIEVNLNALAERVRLALQ